jgi:glutamate N-acetyltransferase/amino-acid N-acetyltransferase
MNIACVVLDEPAYATAGVFTTNRLPGAPVVVTADRLGRVATRGLLINNKIANVAVGTGVDDAKRLSQFVAARIGAGSEDVLVASTGVIGWRLPVEAMEAGIEALFSGRARSTGRDGEEDRDALALARAIMTTDSYPKLGSRAVGEGRIVGVAKGAGMIEPHMATMLSFIFTDCAVDSPRLQEALVAAVDDTFNAITVDGDQSTSDMVVLLSSGRKQCPDSEAFRQALADLCRELSGDVVRNGEGVAHVIEVTVSGAPSNSLARDLARSVANSPLVKTAIYGNDPNVGRLVMAVGDFCGRTDIEPEGLTISIGGRAVYYEGEFHLDGERESDLAAYLRSAAQDPTIKGYRQSDATVAIAITLHAGRGHGRVLGADLSYEYVRENADYRT